MILTPKKRAEELFEKFLLETGNETFAKQCALVALDEIIRTLNEDIRDLDVRGSVLLDLIEYWQEVKQEIEKL